MRRLLEAILLLGCLLALALTCFGPVLFHDRQFGFRDAAHYYYPLYLRVQQEWDAGRWPLWEPEENGGMPLLGNPTAAVLYPGKIIYAILPYAWAARIYVVAHVLLAFVAMLALMHSWGIGWAGAGVASISYAFGAPVLFQYCNIIFLVGAAWLPWGMRAADRWLRLGKRPALLELAVVLALETLGGDPQAAYLTGLCAGGYALGLSWLRSERTGPRTWKIVLGVVLALMLWQGAVLGVARWTALRARAAGEPPLGRARGINPLSSGERRIAAWRAALAPRGLSWSMLERASGVMGLGVVGLALLARWTLRREERSSGKNLGILLALIGWVGLVLGLAWLVLNGSTPLPLLVLEVWGFLGLAVLLQRSGFRTMILGLAGAAALGAGLTAAQLFPVLEYTRLSLRVAEEGPHQIDPFSLEPARVVELLWPNVFGTTRFGNRSWLPLVPPIHSVNVWVPSLYVGGLPLVLALGAWGFRGGPPWRGWLSAVAVVSLAASFGEFGGPLWWARSMPGGVELFGPRDPPETMPPRNDGTLADGCGTIYWLLATALPGFRQFRYPSKLLTLTCLAVSALAGWGFDQLVTTGRSRRAAATTTALWLVTAPLFTLILIYRDMIIVTFSRTVPVLGSSIYGPFQATGAFTDLQRALGQGGVVFALTFLVIAVAGRWPRFASALALALLTADLALANAGLVATVPQAELDRKPRALELIEQAERDEPASGPFRIHRLPQWEPPAWFQRGSPDRVADFVRWEHATLQPKYAVPWGLCYTLTLGVTELYDYHWFFEPFLWILRDRVLAQSFGMPLGRPIVYYPRRGFDLWNTRYFLLPVQANGWSDVRRGFASFLFETEQVYPEHGSLQDPKDRRRWLEEEDFQIFRNKVAFPRAWVVHAAKRIDPIKGLNKADRMSVMEEILFQRDPIWNDPEHVLYDPHEMAWVETDDLTPLAPYLGEPRVDPAETVAITNARPGHYPAQRVELTAVLNRPGLVILADVDYPGWRLTIDDQPARIWRVNRLMRGAAVASGTHHLIYTYDPLSFRAGGVVSIASVALLLGLMPWAARRAVV
jgi:hypothetical protein